MADQTIPQITSNPSYAVYIKDGILYHEYMGDISLSHILDAEKESLGLLRDKNIKFIPIIVLLKNIEKAEYKFSPADFGKAILGFDLTKHISGIWIVGASGGIKKMHDIINTTFFKGKMHLAENFEVAQKEAQSLITASESVLENER